MAYVIIGANGCETRAWWGSSPREDKGNKSEGSQYYTRIQTECIERFREIKSSSLSQTNTSRNIIKSSRINIINSLYHR